jgi:hypothetical protein
MKLMIDKERAKMIRTQIKTVMPLIGGFLDAWDDLPNDVKCDPELDNVREHIERIDRAMEGEG